MAIGEALAKIFSGAVAGGAGQYLKDKEAEREQQNRLDYLAANKKLSPLEEEEIRARIFKYTHPDPQRESELDKTLRLLNAYNLPAAEETAQARVPISEVGQEFARKLQGGFVGKAAPGARVEEFFQKRKPTPQEIQSEASRMSVGQIFGPKLSPKADSNLVKAMLGTIDIQLKQLDSDYGINPRSAYGKTASSLTGDQREKYMQERNALIQKRNQIISGGSPSGSMSSSAPMNMSPEQQNRFSQIKASNPGYSDEEIIAYMTQKGLL